MLLGINSRKVSIIILIDNILVRLQMYILMCTRQYLVYRNALVEKKDLNIFFATTGYNPGPILIGAKKPKQYIRNFFPIRHNSLFREKSKERVASQNRGSSSNDKAIDIMNAILKQHEERGALLSVATNRDRRCGGSRHKRKENESMKSRKRKHKKGQNDLAGRLHSHYRDVALMLLFTTSLTQTRNFASRVYARINPSLPLIFIPRAMASS